LIAMMRLMIQLIRIMKTISNTCNTMLFYNYIILIHVILLYFVIMLFSNTSCLLFLIAGD
jgi:hypothetical protein